MHLGRSAGILLHPTSLPGKYGIGDLGNEAYHFIDFMEHSGQILWQTFPLGPTGYGDSPYQCFSAFAGNPMLISIDKLLEMGLLYQSDLSDYPDFGSGDIDYGPLIIAKNNILQKAFKNFKSSGNTIDNFCHKFIKENKYWLENYALFMAVKEYHNCVRWTDWDKEIAFGKGEILDKWKEKVIDKYEFQIFIQYLFDEQWQNLKEYAHKKGIKIIGDMPIFVAYDSADVWGNKEQFSINPKDGSAEFVAGVPPDYFSATGQLWGNPLYKWKVMEKDNFSWWKSRIKKLLTLCDIIRIDHFRGFDAYWEIPGDAETAITGRWVKAPGEKLFNSIREELGTLPIIAEDLGVITKTVEELRDKFEFPGIKIMQFSFGEEGEKKFLPHNYIPNCVVHTGSHDNETTRGFIESEIKKGEGIYEWAQKYLNYYGNDIVFEMIRTAYASVAEIVVIPLQDMLNLGNEARMNFPGRLGGNWMWRFRWEQIPPQLAATYKEMCKIYERPKTKVTEYEKIVEELE